MHGPPSTHRSPSRPISPRQNHAPTVIAGLIVLATVVGVVVAGTFGVGGSSGTDGALPAAPAPGSTVAAFASAAPVADAPAEAARSVDLGGCQVNDSWIKFGASGDSVACIQKALYAAGSYDGEFHGEFDSATHTAVRTFQETAELYVDGVVGGRTAEALGVWPGDQSFVVRTPEPPPGAVDLLGYPLSSVASAGDDAPAMPANTGQGTGTRIVYSKAGQRVWAIDDEERVVRSYLVTGSRYANELTGVHRIYSRSEVSTAWNGEADLPYMVRWLKTDRGAIGFHAIPLKQSDGLPYQTEEELGTRDSGGCQRQANDDAWFMWNFGDIGTRVIVV